MTAQPAPSNHPVFLLAEHLDLIIAALEDLQAVKPPVVPANPQRVGARAQVSWPRFANDLLEYELAAIAHVSRARHLTRDLVRRDKRFATLGGLFVGGTAPLDEAVARMADVTGTAFASGGDPVGYLRSRGVIDEEAGGPEPGADLVIDDGFRLAGEIEIGPLLDLVAAFLNALELHFDLFPEISEGDDVRRDVSELIN